MESAQNYTRIMNKYLVLKKEIILENIPNFTHSNRLEDNSL